MRQLKDKQHKVYVLLKKGKPIYVGCTSNIEVRIKSHSKLKDFDNYQILKTYNNRKDALIAENSIFRFISLFGGDEWVNSKDKDLQSRGLYLKGGHNG